MILERRRMAELDDILAERLQEVRTCEAAHDAPTAKA